MALLLFEIDEGIGHSGFIYRYRDDFARLDAALEAICSSLSELASQYPVAVLVYPTHHYHRFGFDRSSARPIDRVDAALRHVFEYMRQQHTDVRIFLEAYSSGLATNQNGELASLPPPPLFASSKKPDPGRQGLSVDMETIAALKEEYGDVFAGIRFHEIYGSDIVWKILGRHGFLLDEEVVRACIDVCRDNALTLLWSDSTFLMRCPPVTGEAGFVYSDIHRPYFMSEPFVSLQEYAISQLGERVCFSWANNNYHPTWNLEFLDCKVGQSDAPVAYPVASWMLFDQPFHQFPFKDRAGLRWGMSIQSWFWHELTNTLNKKYYRIGENNCPVEILGSFALKGLREGASILQFEPAWYFFNTGIPYWHIADEDAAREEARDCSGALAFHRLKEMLLDPGAPTNPSPDLENMFDTNQQRFVENDITDPPRIYSQSTLGIIGAGGPQAVLDFYSDGRRWVRQDRYRFGRQVFGGRVRDICRIELQGDGVDELIVVKEAEDGQMKAEIYDQNSRLVGQIDDVVGDNEDGRFVCLATANLVAEVVGEGDPDEIVVIRRNDHSGAMKARVYRVCSVTDRMEYRFAPLTPDESNDLVAGVLGSQWLDQAVFSTLIGLRTEAVMYVDGTRCLDQIAVVTVEGDQAVLRFAGANGSGVCPLGRGVVNPSGNCLVKGIDIDLDRRDEICVIRQQGRVFRIDVHRLNDSELGADCGATVEMCADCDADALRMAALRKTILVNSRLD